MISMLATALAMFGTKLTGVATKMLSFLTGTVVEPASFSDIFDETIIDALINLLKKLTHLFTIFPVNLALISTIVGIAFALLWKAKRTAVKN